MSKIKEIKIILAKDKQKSALNSLPTFHDIYKSLLAKIFK